MDHSTFWRLIEEVDRSALRSGDEEGAVEPLVAALTRSQETTCADNTARHIL